MSDERQRAWAAAGEAAAAHVHDGMRVGLGTGRAAAAGIRALGLRVAAGLRCTGVPTSAASAALARELGIPLGRLRGPLDVAFDGADAVDLGGLVVKGAGGALVRERIVAEAARRFLILVDGPKVVVSLDQWGVLPIAVVPFGVGHVVTRLVDLSPRRRAGLSDDGLAIIDLAIPAGADWAATADRAASIAGVVDHGLFRVALADVVVGRTDGGCDSVGQRGSTATIPG